MNKPLLAAAVASMLWGNFALAAYQDEVLADNPVAYYRFEETSGTTADDTTANANSGTYTNGVLLDQASAAKLGRAARFDGIDDFVNTPRGIATSFTLEMWINTTAASLTGTQAYEGNGLLWSDVGGPGNDFAMAMLNGGLSFFTGNPDATVTGANAINDGAWHHLVATRTQGGLVEIFVDGVSRGTTTTNNNALTGNPSIMIGGNTLDGRYFSGLIDEVAYYPTVLSGTRIAAHFLAGSSSGVTAVPTLSEWTLAGLMALLTLFGARRLRLMRT
jgi:Concanavalin A-like lectin/glucanases superfamily/IPTL-CTERM motif